MKPDEEIHDALYSLKLYSYGTPYNDNVRKYARYFYSKLIKKSRESALELLLYMEKPPSKQKDPQNVSKGKRDNNKSKSSKRNKAKKKQQLTKDNLPTKNEKENEKSKKADKDAEEYDYGVSASPQDQSNEASRFLSEIDTAIEKKKASFELMPEDDEAEPISSAFNNKTPEKTLPKESSLQSTPGSKKNEQSVEEYNKDIQDMNDKAFDKADEIVLSNSDENADILKVEEFDEVKLDASDYKKLENASNSEHLEQETRSEGSPEDQNKLENQGEKLVFVEDDQIKSNNEKFNKPAAENAKKSPSKNPSEKLNDNKIIDKERTNKKNPQKRADSQPDAAVSSPTINKNVQRQNFTENQNFMTDVENKQTTKRHTCNSVVKGTRSAEKNKGKKGQHLHHSTNPTSETSSFKNSSVTSAQDTKVLASESKRKGQKHGKKQSKKMGGKKMNKPIMSDRGEYKNSEEANEPAQTSSKSPPSSIWEQESADVIFSSKDQKKLKKRKKNSKGSKKRKKNQLEAMWDGSKTERSIPSKCSNKFDNGSEVKLDQNKAKSIDVNDKTISIEEKKIDLNIRPTQKDTSMSASKPKSEVKQDTDNRKLSHGSNRNLAHKHKSDNKHGYQKNKKWDEAKKHTIPYETVSSFYHCDENNNFTHANQYSKYHSQEYGHSNDMHGHSMQSDYMDQDHHDYHQYSNHTGGYGDSSSEQLYLGESSHYSEEEANSEMGHQNSVPGVTPSLLENRQFQ